MNRTGTILLILALTALGTACKETKPAKPSAPRESSAATTADAAGDATASMAIHRVVFLDQENCCDCTKERQDGTWQVLQGVLESRSVRPAVEVVHSDTSPDDALMYKDLKPTMVMPGLYFFDRQEVLVDHLQGDVKADQILAILGQ